MRDRRLVDPKTGSVLVDLRAARRRASDVLRDSLGHHTLWQGPKAECQRCHKTAKLEAFVEGGYRIAGMLPAERCAR